jgi:hypothetical protein
LQRREIEDEEKTLAILLGKVSSFFYNYSTFAFILKSDIKASRKETKDLKLFRPRTFIH